MKNATIVNTAHILVYSWRQWASDFLSDYYCSFNEAVSIACNFICKFRVGNLQRVIRRLCSVKLGLGGALWPYPRPIALIYKIPTCIICVRRSSKCNQYFTKSKLKLTYIDKQAQCRKSYSYRCDRLWTQKWRRCYSAVDNIVCPFLATVTTTNCDLININMDATTVSEQVEEVIQADRENEKISLVADAHAEAVATEAEQNVSKKTTQEESFPKQTSTIHTTDFLSSFPSSVADGLITKPFREPLQNCKPQPRPELTSDQAQKYSKFLEFVSSLSGLPVSSKPNAPCTPLSDNERMWLTRECLLRYLRATKWNVTAASERIKSTLIWRRENIGEDKLSPDYISPENEMGKHLVLGWDIHGRPCFYLIPRHECTDKGRRQVEHLIFMLERAIDLLPAGQDTIALVADFASVSRKQAATVSQTREILDFLQNHYPETLGRALAINSNDTLFLLSPFFCSVY